MEDGGTVRVAVSRVRTGQFLVALFFCQPLARLAFLTFDVIRVRDVICAKI